jgi:hypothetical protein
LTGPGSFVRFLKEDDLLNLSDVDKKTDSEFRNEIIT